MLIRKHLVYVDEKSIRSIRPNPPEQTEEDKVRKELEAERERIIQEAQKRAQEILKDAERKAEDILKEAEERAKKVLKDADERINMELKRLEELKGRISKIAGSLDAEIKRVADELADQILPLLGILFRKILEKEMDQELALRRLRSALERIMGLKRVVVRVSPEDVDLLKEEIEKAGYSLTVDSRLKSGDVVIETESGVLNKTTSFQLRVIEEILNEVI